MGRYIFASLLFGLLGAACGEDKNYGDPLGDPTAQAHATQSIGNAMLLDSDAANDTPLNAVNGLSANFNLMAGAKLQHEQMALRSTAFGAVDDGCVVLAPGSFTYSDCDFAGNTVNGSVVRSGDTISIDLSFARSDEDSSTTIDVDGAVDVTATAIDGYVDFTITTENEGFSSETILDGDFDVVLDEQGCAVDGELEVHGKTKVLGQSQSVWAKAEFGPTCGDVIVR